MLKNKVTRAFLMLPISLSAIGVKAQDIGWSTIRDLNVEVYAAGLEMPWSMTWLPNGSLLVTEMEGQLKLISNNSSSVVSVSGVPKVYAEGQSGLLDVVLHPNYLENQTIYLSFTEETNGSLELSVVKGILTDDKLVEVEKVFSSQTVTSEKVGHFGGRMMFDSYNYLYLTIGDRRIDPEEDLSTHPSQQLSNHNGTIIRIHDDGTVPTDNPFFNKPGALPEIWSYGHRNAQGLSLALEGDSIWSIEHGPQGGDELNFIEGGENYGWPVIGYGVNYGAGKPIHSAQFYPSMRQPIHYWVPSIAPSSVLVYSGKLFPEWEGDIFVGSLRGQQINRIEINSETNSSSGIVEQVVFDVGRIRDIEEGPDGGIYIASEQYGILRITP